jgi:two-component system, chemotaxis family, chemotaxis protein CheY
VKKIMIIDDSATMLMSLQGMLARTTLSVEKATSGEDAVSKLNAGLKPAMVITDFNMGKMNGIDVVRAVRKVPGLQFIPVVLLTTESQRDKRDEARSAGATGWLVKPVEADALLKLVRQLVPGA